MRCKIAELIVEIPEAGDLVPRCRDYLCEVAKSADICIREEDFLPEYWPTLSENTMIYMESGVLFYLNLLLHSGFMLHSSAVALDGKAYLFSGHSGMGKSTHTRLWQRIFGDRAEVFNDDKPALRYLDGVWYAYGTPWCGKDGINLNRKYPIAGICFLKQADHNRIRRLSPFEAGQQILSQTLHRFRNAERMDLLLEHINCLIQNIPVFELENRPEPEAARLSHDTMLAAAEEMNL